MMKKLMVLLFILAMVNVASAGVVDIVITSLNGAPITPTKEITILPTDVVNMDVTYQSEAGLFLFSMSFDIVAQGPGTLDGSQPTWPTGIWDPALTTIIPHDGKLGVSGAAAFLGLPGPSGIAVDHILMHCDAPGDVLVSLVENPGLPAGGSVEVNEAFDVFFPTFGPGVVIHQVPEPMTLTLLGLGSLFLARRKK